MKTKLLQSIATANRPEFLNDLRKLVVADHKELVHSCLNWVTSYIASSSDAERDKLIGQVANKNHVETPLVRRIFNILAFIAIGGWQRGIEASTPDAFCEDVQDMAQRSELQPLSEKEISRLRELVSDLAGRSPEFRRSNALSVVKRGVLPMYEEIQATVELRSSQTPLLLDSDLAALSLELFPIASVRLSLDSGEPSFICFQITEAEVLDLIEKLQQLHSTMVNLKESVSIKTSDSAS